MLFSKSQIEWYRIYDSLALVTRSRRSSHTICYANEFRQQIFLSCSVLSISLFHDLSVCMLMFIAFLRMNRNFEFRFLNWKKKMSVLFHHVTWKFTQHFIYRIENMLYCFLLFRQEFYSSFGVLYGIEFHNFLEWTAHSQFHSKSQSCTCNVIASCLYMLFIAMCKAFRINGWLEFEWIENIHHFYHDDNDMMAVCIPSFLLDYSYWVAYRSCFGLGYIWEYSNQSRK